MYSKEDILNQIKRTAKQNAGIPLGKSRFEKEIGIKPYDWEKYWIRFGDAQKEAGFTPNKLRTAYSQDYLIDKIISLIRKIERFPVYGDLKMESRNNSAFPNPKTFFENKIQKQELARKIFEFCKNKNDYQDITTLCKPIIEDTLEDTEDTNTLKYDIGEVYLFKSGRYYKIGKTNNTVRRGAELRIQLPENINLIHSIKTDDPGGIESYWHKRFAQKRKNGEWFDLNPSEVKAFKRWKRIY